MDPSWEYKLINVDIQQAFSRPYSLEGVYKRNNIMQTNTKK
jgi:hypothetical protein